MTASSPGPGPREILCAAFEDGSLFPWSFGSPAYKPCRSSKPNVLRVHLPSAGPLGWGALDPSLFGENQCNSNYPPVWGPPPVIMELDYTLTLTLLPFSLWFLLFFNLVFFQLEYSCITVLSWFLGFTYHIWFHIYDSVDWPYRCSYISSL